MLRYLVANKVRTVNPDLLSEKDRLKLEATTTDVSSEDIKGPKLKGQNKNRPAPMKFDMGQRICPVLVDVGEGEETKTCPYGENCSYRHDLKAYIAEKKGDILPGGCIETFIFFITMITVINIVIYKNRLQLPDKRTMCKRHKLSVWL